MENSNHPFKICTMIELVAYLSRLQISIALRPFGFGRSKYLMLGKKAYSPSRALKSIINTNISQYRFYSWKGF